MFKSAIALHVSIATLLAASHSNAECSSKLGGIIEMEQPYLPFELLARANATKDEFETTPDYQIRLAASKAFVKNRKFIAEITPSRSGVEYDADNERLKISVYAWSLIGGHFDQIFTEDNALKVPELRSSDKVHGLGLLEIRIGQGSYSATNVYGAVTTVNYSSRKIYSLFDRTARANEKMWALDFPPSGDFLKNNYVPGGIFIAMPAAKARQLKESIRFAVEFSAKEPFAASATGYRTPTLSQPSSSSDEVNMMFGKITCAIVTDEKGTVLKLVPVSYK